MSSIDLRFLANDLARLREWLVATEDAATECSVFHMIFFRDVEARAEARRRLGDAGYGVASVDAITPDEGDPYAFWLEPFGHGLPLAADAIERHLGDTLALVADLDTVYNGFHVLVPADGRTFEP